MPRKRRLHPEYELDEDGSPIEQEVVIAGDVEAQLREPLSPLPRAGRGAPDHPAKAWFMQRGFFALDALGLTHKDLDPIYRRLTGAKRKDLPSQRAVARWWAEWAGSPTKGRRGAPVNRGRWWFMRYGFAMQKRRGWTDHQLREEYEATSHVPPFPSCAHPATMEARVARIGAKIDQAELRHLWPPMGFAGAVAFLLLRRGDDCLAEPKRRNQWQHKAIPYCP